MTNSGASGAYINKSSKTEKTKMSEEEPDSWGTSLYEPVTSFALTTSESIADVLWKPFIAVKKWFTALEEFELICFGCCIPIAAVFLIQVAIHAIV